MTLRCKFCQHYRFEGRRGGACQLLNVTISGEDLACSQVVSRFTAPSSHQTNAAGAFVSPGLVLNLSGSEQPPSPLVCGANV